MEPILLEKSELLALLDLLGIDTVAGLGPEHLPQPEPYERPIILDDGRSRLLEHRRLSVAEDHYEIDPELEAILVVLAKPESMVSIWHSADKNIDSFWRWYFVSGSELVQLTADGTEQFELGRVDDTATALAQIAEILSV
jgi:hypothetical protein